MVFFKKRDEIVDLREMQKRGILKNIEALNKNTETFVFPPQSESKPKTAFASFWDTPVSTSAVEKQEANTDLSNINVKIENLECKLERLLERLEKLEENLNKND